MLLAIKKEEPDWSKAIQGNPLDQEHDGRYQRSGRKRGTVVIGGVFVTTTIPRPSSAFPGRPAFPGLGFQVQGVDELRRELLVFITPRTYRTQID